MAIHPVMDVTSPAHTDQNGSPIPWCGPNLFSCSQWWLHGDNWGTVENLKHLNAHPEVQKKEDIMIRGLFETVTGKKLECCSN